MARRRKAQGEEGIITAEQVGGSAPDVYAELAQVGEYPEEYEQEGAVWQAGWDIAARRGNTPKACIIFANNYQGEDLSDAEIQEEIKRLTKIQAERGKA